MADAVKLYQFGAVPGRESASPFCVKVHYALRYKRVPFEVVNVATPSAIRKLSSRGKLPVVTFGATVVADSSAIVEFLEQHHPEPRLYPQDPRARANALLLEDWADESLYWHAVYENWLVDDQFVQFAPHIFAAIPASIRPVVNLVARRQTRAQIRAQGLGRMTLDEQRRKLCAALDSLDALLDGAFLCGSNLSVADLAVAAQIASLTSPFNQPTAREVARRTKLASWLDRVKSAVT
jgi:glutathione S-transferase